MCVNTFQKYLPILFFLEGSSRKTGKVNVIIDQRLYIRRTFI